jgi:acyl-CoA-binding protein
VSDLHTQFNTAAEAAKQLRRRPDNATMLKLYALYKQATSGDVAGARPGMLDMVGQAKYDAWAAVKGTTREAAMQSYIDLVETLK